MSDPSSPASSPADSQPPGGGPPAGSSPPVRRRWKRWLGGTALLLTVAAVALGVSALPFVRLARGWWDEAIQVADAHARYTVAHPGWSFPARIQTADTSLELPPEKLVVEAKARGYQADCRDAGPGEYCAKTGRVVPRTGNTLEPIELGWLIGPDAEIRVHLPLEEAPKLLIDAILAAEDRDYYRHHGVNFGAMIRATLTNAQERTYVQGGSTLTMQLVRNLVQRKEKTLERKLREMVMALAIDRHLGKDRVLQMYLDAPYLGQKGGLSICGFAAAAQFYFGRDVRELSLAQAATLAAILPAPAKFAPNRFPERARERRDRVLRSMAEVFGYDVQAALAEPVSTVPSPPATERYPAFLSAARAWLETRLPPEVLYGAGLTITASVDVFLQEKAETFFPDRTRYLEQLIHRRGEEPLESASVLIDNADGRIRAIYGGRDVTSTSFNLATQARRQAGSSFKPLVYALAFSQPSGPDGAAPFTAASVEPNSPRVFKTPQGNWQPRNLGGEYTETACLAQGLAWSQNIATASLLEALGGPEALIAFAGRLGFNTRDFPAELGLALGQGEVTVLEMAQFAAIVANGGRRVTGTPVLRAVDAAGKVWIDAPRAGDAVMTPEAAALTRELMRLVIDVGTGGAARGAGPETGYAGPAMGKTGTTDKERDLWFVGATPRYSSVVWLGHDTPASLHASASDLAAPLWGWWMHQATRYDGPPPPFPAEPKIVRRDICTITGRRPNGTCRVIAAPFLPGTAPKDDCPVEHPPPEPEEGEEGEEGEDGEVLEAAELESSPSPVPGEEEKPPPSKRKRYESVWKRMAREKEEEAKEEESVP